MSDTTDLIDRMDQLGACMRCLADLCMPETDLHAVSRDDLATALGFLTSEYQAASAALKDLARPRPVRVV